MKIAHLSDVHFGRIAHPDIVEALVRQVNEEHGADVVVVSGDLTQRARTREYHAAQEMIRSFRAPVVVVPGNHDVFPWWYPLARLSDPLRRFRRFISREAVPTFTAEGLAVAGLNSAFGQTIKGGRISRSDLRVAQEFFRAQRPGTFKVLAVHHHLLRIQALGSHDVARRAKETLDMAADCGVELVLCGHLHVSHVEPKEIRPAGHRLIIASAGTATSNRGRSSDRETNYFNVVHVEPAAFSIQEHLFNVEHRRFECYRTVELARKCES